MPRSRAKSRFCAYNTGIGWRNIIEKMHMTATLTKWYEEHGRHEIFAGGKTVPLATTEHSLKLNAEAVAAGAQTDLDELGIAKNAREEKLRARDELKKKAENDRMARALSPARAEGGQAAGSERPPDPGPEEGGTEGRGRTGGHALAAGGAGLKAQGSGLRAQENTTPGGSNPAGRFLCSVGLQSSVFGLGSLPTSDVRLPTSSVFNPALSLEP